MATERWNIKKAAMLYQTPFLELLFKAQQIHQQHFNANEIELCTLLSIKTGACPEDCAYCPQSGHYQTTVHKEKLLPLEQVLQHAAIAKANGAVRFCMGAAWRNPTAKDFKQVIEMIKAVKNLGLETCVTLGMLTKEQAQQLKEAGLDFYNHNLDTSPEYYQKIISTRTYQDRLKTLAYIHEAELNICCGGIIGMGESRQDRIAFLVQLAKLTIPPKSIPINRLVPARGTPLANAFEIDNLEFIKTIAVARIMMPSSVIRLSAGRETMSEEMQALCYLAGANSIFYGEKLLTAANVSAQRDLELLKRLGLNIKKNNLLSEPC